MNLFKKLPRHLKSIRLTKPFITNKRFFSENLKEEEREVIEYDVAIVGAGPAGLSCAIRLKQLQQVFYFKFKHF